MTEPCEEVKRVEQRYEKALDDMEKHYKDVLEQIRTEIEAYGDKLELCKASPSIDYIMQIIDKYR